MAKIKPYSNLRKLLRPINHHIALIIMITPATPILTPRPSLYITSIAIALLSTYVLAPPAAMNLETVVPSSICRDMQHPSTEYACQARDKMEGRLAPEIPPALTCADRIENCQPSVIREPSQSSSQSSTLNASFILHHGAGPIRDDKDDPAAATD